MLNKFNHYRLHSLYLSFGIIGFVFSQWLISLLFILLSCYLISRLIQRNFFNSLVSGLIFGFSIWFAFISVTASLLWLINLDMSLIRIGILSSTCLVILLIAINRDLNFTNHHTSIIDKSDFSAILVVLCFLVFYVHSSRITNPTKSITVEAIQNTTKALDDQNHFIMFDDTIHQNKGILLGNRGFYQDNSLLSVYPKGVHISLAVLAKSTGLEKNDTVYNTIKSLKTYALLKSFIFLLSIYTLSRFSMELFKRIKSVLPSTEYVSNYIIGACLSSYAAIVYLVPLYMDGALSLIPTLTFLTLAILCFAAYQSDTTKKSSLVCLGILAVASTLTWTIAGIPIYLALFLLAIKTLASKNRFKIKVGKLSIIILSVILGSIQYYVQQKGNVAALNINALGGFYTFNTFLPLVVGATVFIADKKIKHSKESHGILFASLQIITVLFSICALISIINFKTTGSVQYYFIKLLYVPLILLSYVAIGQLTSLFGNFFNPKSIIDSIVQKLSVLALLISLLIIAFPPNFGVIDYLLNGHRSISSSSASILANELDKYSVNSKVSTFVFLDNVPHFENIMINHTINGISRGDYCQGIVFDKLYSKDNIDDLLTDNIVKECRSHDSRKIKIVTNSAQYNDLQDKYSEIIDIEIVKLDPKI